MPPCRLGFPSTVAAAMVLLGVIDATTTTVGCDLIRVERIEVCCIHLKVLKDYLIHDHLSASLVVSNRFWAASLTATGSTVQSREHHHEAGHGDSRRLRAIAHRRPY
jgi:hypothetical protein